MTKRTLYIGAIILGPIVAFYGLLARETVNLPFMDDYGGVLGFVSDWSQLPTLHEKMLEPFVSQHNEYKLMFANVLYVLQYMVTGHINFAVLSAVGNLLMLPIYFIIYGMWAGRNGGTKERLLLFAPVSWLLFQFQYYSLLNWPMSSLQHIAVLLFSLLTIYLLSKDELWAFYLSLSSLLLAIGSSGNGFFLVPVACLMLGQFRRPARILCLLCASATMFAFYLYRYNFNSSQAHADHSIISSLHHISPLYALSFLGASIATYKSYMPASILGACIFAVFVYSIYDKYYSRNPAVFYSIFFILITSLAVSGLRSDLGIAQSLVSRYRIYSNLMLVFVYLYASERLQTVGATHKQNYYHLIRSPLAVAIAIGAILFNLGSNYAGFNLLRARTELTTQGINRFEMGEQSITTADGPTNEDPVIRRQRLSGNYEPQAQFLRRAESLNIYAPPRDLLTNP